MARIDAERGGEWTLGQSLFFQLPYFADPSFFFDPDVADVLDDYRVSMALGVPLAATLDELPAFRADKFAVIAEELAAIRRNRETKRR